MQMSTDNRAGGAYKEELELLRESDGVTLDDTMIRPARKAGEAGEWRERRGRRENC